MPRDGAKLGLHPHFWRPWTSGSCSSAGDDLQRRIARCLVPVTRVAACAVIRHPLAGRAQDDLSDLVPFGEMLGAQLAKEALAALRGPAVSYGKAAIIGPGRRHRARRRHYPPENGTADARGDRRRQGDHSLKRQGSGAERSHRYCLSATADDPWLFDYRHDDSIGARCAAVIGNSSHCRAGRRWTAATAHRQGRREANLKPVL